MSTLVAGLLAGLGIAMPVGAVGVYLVTLAAHRSVRVAACAALGVASADGVYAVVAVVGGRVVAQWAEAVAGPLQVVSVVALLAVGVKIAVDAIRLTRVSAETVHAPSDPSALRAYFSLLGLTLANPATIVYFVALVTGNRAGTADGAGLAVVFVVGVFVASAAWQLTLVTGGRMLAAIATGRRGRLVTSLAGSAVVIALAVATALG
ncbi:LysE family transporter [Angustibacter sp. McL0619]|uniref:LysE family transporter n=1 Tax=Angustibacter sp. McL0619 TaxID=3415676 RepID=UPI003CEA4492